MATFQKALIPGYTEKDCIAWYCVVSSTTRVHVQTYAYSHNTTSLHVPEYRSMLIHTTTSKNICLDVSNGHKTSH